MQTKPGAGTPSPAKVAEKLRLAAALRANLRRRKVAREVSDPSSDARAADAAPDDDPRE